MLRHHSLPTASRIRPPQHRYSRTHRQQAGHRSVRRRSFLDGELFRAPHRPLVDEPANGHADDEAEEDAQVVDDAGAEGHVVVLGELRQPVADEDVDEELRRRKGGGEREVPRGDARDRGQEAVAQAEGQGTEADGGQHEQAVVAQDVAQGDEPAVLAHEPLHVAAEHGAAGEERGRRPDDGGGRHDEPAARKAEDEARDGHRRAVPDQRRERRRGRQQEQQRPAPGQVPPALGHGVQGREDAVREHEEQDRHYQDHGPERPGQNALQGRHAVAQLHQLVRYRDAALHEAVAQRPVLLVGAGAAPRVRRREPPHPWRTGFAEGHRPAGPMAGSGRRRRTGGVAMAMAMAVTATARETARKGGPAPALGKGGRRASSGNTLSSQRGPHKRRW